MTESDVIQEIASVGQTGVDRAAPDVAMEPGIPCGGRCPKGRLATDGMLVLNVGKLTGGTAYTVDVAREKANSFIVVQLDTSAEPRFVIDWIVQHDIHVPNVAGTRENKQAGMHALARGFLTKVLQGYASHPS